MGIETTPADQISGLPLLIAPEERALSVLNGLEPRRDEFGTVVADWNHVFHPGKQVLSGGDGSAAVRNARLQYVLRSTHDEYHSAYFGPGLPTTVPDRFKTAVLCAAGYIPMQAIKFGNKGPRVVNLMPLERERLRSSGEVKVASFSAVQKFMREFVLGQPVDHIKPRTIDQFLRTDPSDSSDSAKKHRYLTHLLLSLVIDRVEDDLVGPYTFAYGYDLLKPDVPARPDRFVQSVLTPNRKNTRGVAKELTRKLLVHRDGPAAVTCMGKLALA